MSLLIAAAGYPVVRWERRLVHGRLRRTAYGVYHHYLLHGRLPLRRRLADTGYQTVDRRQLLDARVGLVVIEDARTLPAAIPLAKRAGRSVLVIPQNVDALYDAGLVGRTPAATCQALAAELVAYRRADAVVCIAREEQWLLRCLGVPADYLPYFPPEPIRSRFLAVRAARAAAPNGPAVILGNAGNVPNRLGMERLLRDLGPTAAGLDMVLVGYRTDELKGLGAAVGVRVLGEVGEDDFSLLLAQARAVVVHQEYGAGSLTKITEMLTAGVPVLASETAARSHFEYEGVHSYADSAGLLCLLRADLPVVPVPASPAGAERRFVASVRRMLGAAG